MAQIAQLVEQRIENPRVRGSNPRLGTIKINNLAHTGLNFHVASCCNRLTFVFDGYRQLHAT